MVEEKSSNGEMVREVEGKLKICDVLEVMRKKCLKVGVDFLKIL